MYNTTRYKYSISERKTKKSGTVYDISFYYVDAITGKRTQKQKRGFKTKKSAREYYTDFVTNLLVAPTKTTKGVLMYEDARSVYFSAISQSVKESLLVLVRTFGLMKMYIES